MKKLLSILLALALLASCAAAAAADPEPEDFVCPEDQIATKIPAGAAARFEEDNGLVIYTQAEGYIPYVIVHRRPLENKFKNPENYLNNVFREYMEETHQDKYLGMYGAAKVVETGGKTLLEGCYKFKIGDTPVTLLRLIEIRDGGDVEYTAKFTEDTEEITMAALDLAVRYYRETDLEAPETPETPEAPAAPAGTGIVPAFLIPSEFVTRFNSAMEALADQYAGQLGEDNVQALKDYYTFTEKDPQGSLVYYGTKNWQFEAGFYFPDENAPTDTMTAQLMNFTVKKDAPEIAANIGRRIFELLVAYEYQDDALTNAMHVWFESAGSSGDSFSVPGYTLNVFYTADYTQYAVLPADAGVPENAEPLPDESGPAENTGSTPAADEGEWAEYHCEEDGFTTKKPYHALTQYKTDKGYVGIAFYLDVPGFPPYVLVHRRPAEGKFKNPEGYLNNTYREFLEDKFEGSDVLTTLAGTWEAGGKQLIGAKYLIRTGENETTQLQLIEVRELGDVEYTVMYSGAEEEALAMKALDAAVANYIEDEAQKPAAAGKSGTDGTSRTLTADEERRLLSIEIDYKTYILGQSTPIDMARDGWDVSIEEDGTIVLTKDYMDGMILVSSDHGAMDRPIREVNAFWADGIEVAYCEFDGAINPGLAEGQDPDQVWNREYPYEILVNAWERDDIHIDPWGAMCNWLVDTFGAKQNEEGIYEAEVTLSDGRTLRIASHDSPVCISLNPN